MAPRKLNGFMVFVRELRQGKDKNMALPQAVSQGGVLWQKMTQLERTPYEEEAKKANLLRGGNPNDRVARIDLAQREASERLEEMKRRTEAFVLEASANDLGNAKFVFIYFNVFTKTLSGDMYLPAEFSACEFSLRQGILSGYTTLINPGRIDLGQCHDAQHHSSTTHNLPLPPNALGDHNCLKIYAEVWNYLRKCRGCQTIIVFTTTLACPIAEACFHFLAPKSNHDLGIEILSLEYLLFFLKRQVLQAGGLSDAERVSKVCTDAYIKQDQYEFTPSIACPFHEDIDRSNYCSLCLVRRWAYSFCNYLCGDLNITVKPGKHIPPGASSGDDPGGNQDTKSSIKTEIYPCLAGFGRGRARGRIATLGEASR